MGLSSSTHTHTNMKIAKQLPCIPEHRLHKAIHRHTQVCASLLSATMHLHSLNTDLHRLLILEFRLQKVPHTKISPYTIEYRFVHKLYVKEEIT